MGSDDNKKLIINMRKYDSYVTFRLPREYERKRASNARLVIQLSFFLPIGRTVFAYNTKLIVNELSIYYYSNDFLL